MMLTFLAFDLALIVLGIAFAIHSRYGTDWQAAFQDFFTGLYVIGIGIAGLIVWGIVKLLF